jgi:quercetin dioxygenase-like cupin family protein
MSEMEQLPIETTHTFAPSLYARTIHVPKGATLVGMTHKTEHIFILAQGEMTLVSDEGRKRIRAPYQAVCKPGIKRAGYAHEDSICTNIHINQDDETDLAVLQGRFVEQEALTAPECQELQWRG